MNILINASGAIGDFVSRVVPFGAAIHNRGDQVSFYIWGGKVIRDLAVAIPWLKSCIVLDEKTPGFDLRQATLPFDRVVLSLALEPSDFDLAVYQRLGLKCLPVVNGSLPAFLSRPDKVLRRYGYESKPSYQRISLDWYEPYQRDFQCSDRSILINGASTSLARSYLQTGSLVEMFQREGYDVRMIDDRRDIRENLFLIDQVKHVITVDTSVLWLARALGKKPMLLHDQRSSAPFGLPAADIFRSDFLNLNDPCEIFNWAEARCRHKDGLKSHISKHPKG